MNDPSEAGVPGELASNTRSSTPSSGWPWVMGNRCGWLHRPDVTKPRARTISMPPARSERSTSTLVTISTGAGGPLPGG